MIHMDRSHIESKQFRPQEESQSQTQQEMVLKDSKSEEFIQESADNQALLSRENSSLLSLLREESFPFSIASLVRENSIEQSLVRESSAALSLGRETSSTVDLNQLITSANVHDFLLEHPPNDDGQQQGCANAGDEEEAKPSAEIPCQKGVPSSPRACEDVQSEEDHRESNVNSESRHEVDDTERGESAVDDSADESEAPVLPLQDATYVQIESHQVPTQSNGNRASGKPQESMRYLSSRTSKRGAHVKGRPDMQKKARDGLAHWSKQLKYVRAAWSVKAATNPDFRSEYQGQIDLSVGRIKSKQECLLRVLQLAAADGYIRPGPFESGGFFGWTKFDVVQEHIADFRRCVEKLFPAGFREDTLKETFRRSGLVPERWQWHLGWRGQASWIFNTRDRQ